MTRRQKGRLSRWTAASFLILLIAFLISGCAASTTSQSPVKSDEAQVSSAEKQGVIRIGYQKTGQ